MPERRPIRFAALLAAALFAVAGASGCVDPGVTSCRTHADCAEGAACVSGSCRTRQEGNCLPGRQRCESGADCTSEACEGGCCAPTCASRLDCHASETCFDGLCLPTATLPTCESDRECEGRIGIPRCHPLYGLCVACVADSDCGESGDFACEDSRCVLAPGTCTRAEDCTSEEAAVCDGKQGRCVQCVADGHCAADERCEADRRCRPRPIACTRHEQCSVRASTPWCQPDRKLCVACLEDGHCPGDGSSRCNPAYFTCDETPGCGGDEDCAGGYCRGDRRCVSCLDDAHCPGGRCLSDSTCGGERACATDGDCSEHTQCDLTQRRCVECLVPEDCGERKACLRGGCVPTSRGCLEDVDCTGSWPRCRTETRTCVSCLADQDCGPLKRCTTNECVPVSCIGDGECAAANPARPFCHSSGTCIACRHDGHCRQDEVCRLEECVSVPCVDDSGCRALASRPRCEPWSGVCVRCLDAEDCGERQDCRENACVDGCASHAECAGLSGTPFCRTDTGYCVACVARGDCPAGHDCQGNTCVPTGVDQPCAGGWRCAEDQLCVQEGSSEPVCRTACELYAADPGCPAGQRCAMAGFSASGRPEGACLPQRGGGGPGAMCGATNPCEVGLLCVAESTSAGRCRAYCDPEAPVTCVSPLACQPLVRFDARQIPRVIGACFPDTRYLDRCATDESCDPGQICAAGADGQAPLRPTNVCQWPTTGPKPRATGCVQDADCRSGLCLSGGTASSGFPGFCQGGCERDSHCSGGQSCGAEPLAWRDGAGSVVSVPVASCIPRCKGEFDCTANNACDLVPNFEGTAWATRCAPGTQSGFQHYGGYPCTSDAQCWSGVCLRNAANATDGFCLGTCDPARNGADCHGQAADCPSYGVRLRVSSGPDGQAGTSDDVFGAAPICWGRSCTWDGNCTGMSADASRPRACAPSPDPRNPNDLVLGCLPRVGSGAAGAVCNVHNDCRSGFCVTWLHPTDATRTKKRCFGGCRNDYDCAAADTYCVNRTWTSTQPNKIIWMCQASF